MPPGTAETHSLPALTGVRRAPRTTSLHCPGADAKGWGPPASRPQALGQGGSSLPPGSAVRVCPQVTPPQPLSCPGLGSLAPLRTCPLGSWFLPMRGLPGFVHQVLLALLRPGLPSALVSGLHDPQGSCPCWNPAGSMARTSQEGEPSGSRLESALAAHPSITEERRGPGLGVSVRPWPTFPGGFSPRGERGRAAGRGRRCCSEARGAPGFSAPSSRTHLRPARCPQRPEHRPNFASQSCPGNPGHGQDGDLTRPLSEELTQGGGQSLQGRPRESLEDPSGRGEAGGALRTG